MKMAAPATQRRKGGLPTNDERMRRRAHRRNPHAWPRVRPLDKLRRRSPLCIVPDLMRFASVRFVSALISILGTSVSGCALSGGARLGSASPDTTAIRRDIAYLSSEALEGRG